ncbi:hypothetical protein LTR84_007392 [Exophiala bonariae]|uniref:RBR-type E3 ubiquitin transferase n=1 Tax=Exophiala bonariae TaxID=1690606 RepID=A0AAV9N0A1_9EURO|nr:hypothetical protein LTR84_007392 [Exophiala bonariae]
MYSLDKVRQLQLQAEVLPLPGFLYQSSANPSLRSVSPSSANRLGASAATPSLHTDLGPLTFQNEPLSPLSLPIDITSHTVPSSKDPVNDQIMDVEMPGELTGPSFTCIAIHHSAEVAQQVSADIDRTFRILEGYLGTRIEAGTFADRRICIVDFRTWPAAAKAFYLHPQIFISGQIYAVNPILPDNLGNLSNELRTENVQRNNQEQAAPVQTLPIISPPPTGDRPRKRLKKEPPKPKVPQCAVCFTDLEGPYAVPCLGNCTKSRCYDCLKREFQVAMSDMERMPVQCCGRVMHYEVAQDILPAVELEAYKTRFIENGTPNPLYCPMPRCSTYIPSRLIPEGATRVACFTCLAAVCTKCKNLANDTHVCGKNEEYNSIIKKFKYKVCPKCNTGVMKMFGCAHVRCNCGAHWCWDCRRPIMACNSNPCRTAREDGARPENPDDELVLDLDSDSDADMGVTEPEIEVLTSVEEARDAVTSATQEVVRQQESIEEPTQQATEEQIQQVEGEDTSQVQVVATSDETPTEIENLDDPDRENWEDADLFFGPEPEDEYTDTWGCAHRFELLKKRNIPKFWKVGSDPTVPGDFKVGCLSCFQRTTVWEDHEELEPPSGTAQQPEKSDDCQKRTPSKEILLAKKNSTDDHAFWCQMCMIIVCGLCRDAHKRQWKRNYKVEV